MIMMNEREDIVPIVPNWITWERSKGYETWKWREAQRFYCDYYLDICDIRDSGYHIGKLSLAFLIVPLSQK